MGQVEGLVSVPVSIITSDTVCSHADSLLGSWLRKPERVNICIKEKLMFRLKNQGKKYLLNLPSKYFALQYSHFKKRTKAKLLKTWPNIARNLPMLSATPKIALNELVIAKNVDSNIIVTEENVCTIASID